MYNISNDLSPLFIRDMVTKIDAPYNMRSTTKVEKYDNGNLQFTKKSNYEISNVNTVSYGLECIRYLCPKIWKLIPNELEELKSVELFKKENKRFDF